jgi:hypothetical protein
VKKEAGAAEKSAVRKELETKIWERRRQMGVNDSAKVLGANDEPIKKSNFKEVIKYWLTADQSRRRIPPGTEQLRSRMNRDPELKSLFSAYKRQQFGQGFRPSIWKASH